jgi:hypothetical protein
MARKKYQHAIDEKEYEDESDVQETQNSEMVLPEANVFNIEAKVANKNNETKTTDDNSQTMESHHKFSKFSKFRK